jgi:hypothetical protein
MVDSLSTTEEGRTMQVLHPTSSAQEPYLASQCARATLHSNKSTRLATSFAPYLPVPLPSSLIFVLCISYCKGATLWT